MLVKEDISYSTGPMEIVKRALKNSNQELLRLIVIRTGIEEIKARIDDLRQKIEQCRVSGIFETFSEL